MFGKVKCTCENCGKEFKAYSSEVKKGGGKFCSSGCFHASRVSKVKQVCQYCQNEFEALPSTVNRGKGKFCSQQCRENGKTSIHTCEKCGKTFKIPRCYADAGRGKYCSQECFFESLPKQVEVSCQECGKTFKIKSPRIKAGGGKFCSKKCADKALSRPVRVTCQRCGKAFDSVESEKRKFCSNQCRGEWYGETFTGESHPRWKGGDVDYGLNWDEQRKKALKRDNYTCQYCGKKKPLFGRNHDVHHRIPVRTFGYIPGENDNYKVANDLSNLITLCQSCHKKAETGKIIV